MKVNAIRQVLWYYIHTTYTYSAAFPPFCWLNTAAAVLYSTAQLRVLYDVVYDEHLSQSADPTVIREYQCHRRMEHSQRYYEKDLTSEDDTMSSSSSYAAAAAGADTGTDRDMQQQWRTKHWPREDQRELQQGRKDWINIQVRLGTLF